MSEILCEYIRTREGNDCLIKTIIFLMKADDHYLVTREEIVIGGGRLNEDYEFEICGRANTYEEVRPDYDALVKELKLLCRDEDVLN